MSKNMLPQTLKGFRDFLPEEKRKEVLKNLLDMGVSGCKKGCRLDAINQDLMLIKRGELSLEDVKPKEGEKPPIHVNFI